MQRVRRLTVNVAGAGGPWNRARSRSRSTISRRSTVELSTALQRQYSLQHAYAVTADSNNSADRVETVAKATAELMHSILHDGDVIGVDCGRTVAHVAPHLSRLPKCDVIQLTVWPEHSLPTASTSSGGSAPSRVVRLGPSTPRWPWRMRERRAASPTILRFRKPALSSSKVSCAIVSIGAWSARRVPGLHVATRRRCDAAGRGVCAETCALLLDANCTGYTDSTNAAWASATGTSAPFPPSLPSPPVPRRSPRRGPYYWCLPCHCRHHHPATPASASAPSGADQCSDSGRDGLWRSAIRSHCDDPAQNYDATGNGTVAGVAQRIPASSRVRLGVSSDDSRLMADENLSRPAVLTYSRRNSGAQPDFEPTSWHVSDVA